MTAKMAAPGNVAVGLCTAIVLALILCLVSSAHGLSDAIKSPKLSRLHYNELLEESVYDKAGNDNEDPSMRRWSNLALPLQASGREKSEVSDRVTVSVSERGANSMSPIAPRFESNFVSARNRIGSYNLNRLKTSHGSSNILTAKTLSSKFLPGNPVDSFHLPTLSGPLMYPGPTINSSTPVLIHAFNEHSGFLQCLWNCTGSIDELIKYSPSNIHFIFISNSVTAYGDALWMRNKFKMAFDSTRKVSNVRAEDIFSRLHFVTIPLYEAGNWIPQALSEWSCPDHNCGLDQIVIQIASTQDGVQPPLILMRLDARYDWLPSPALTFGNKTLPLKWVNETAGCKPIAGIEGALALVPNGGCSYFKKVKAMQASGAKGVVIMQGEKTTLEDMNCLQEECSEPLTIPATIIPYDGKLINIREATLRFQNTPSGNFFLGLDSQGRLSEVGWFLYPTFRFLAWQAQWFNYKAELDARLASEKALIVSVFNRTVMQGEAGAVARVHLPDLKELRRYGRFELDLALSCPGERDEDCPHWDHTVQLYVCCKADSSLCNMELGRWITAFRRRIGRWLTDVTSLLPLLESDTCTFTLKTVAWALPWIPSLNLRFSQYNGSPDSTYPSQLVPLYQPQFTFDSKYNGKFQPMTFKVSSDSTKVLVVAVITGHGSDENGCGEFCVTSHHFVVNGHSSNRTFDTAGSPFGCAERVPQGVEPNEHGTWLYGRDGWCDGQEVTPWVMDITSQVKVTGENTLHYYGWFNGTDPNPKKNPGIMIFSSYLVFYEALT